MPPGISVSIIISTRDRAAALQKTLDALEKVRIPADCKAEVIVVDNGSTDDTAKVVRTANLPKLNVEYLYEPRRGKSNALNAGLVRAQGEIILFTDDDVFMSEDWVEQMVAVFLQRQADAVVGKIVLAQNLQRPWLSVLQRWWLAAPGDQSDDRPEMIGANMGIRRSVLNRVPGFDSELGPGALGLGEEWLFASQLAEAGFRIAFARMATVIHQPEISRLRRNQWLTAARQHGRQHAYIGYHWEHDDISVPRLRWFWNFIKLQSRRILQPPPDLESEGCPEWEMRYVLAMETYKQFLLERRRPRNYSRRGLVKRVV
jgi:glucosyl-dolichyl phosphate glucuronosyltransferase